MSRNDENKAERPAPRDIANGLCDQYQNQTKAVAVEVPAKEILMSWIEDAERSLIGQLTSLQQVKDRIRYADEYTCAIVRDLIRSDIRRHF